MDLPIKKLIIGVIKKGDSVLLRKKFPGDKPYKQTWYLLGCPYVEDQDPSQAFIDYAKNELGIEITFVKSLSEDDETKEDHDNIKKHFIYISKEFEFVKGNPLLPKDHEKINFIDIKTLKDLDLVPPTTKLLQQAGYLK